MIDTHQVFYDATEHDRELFILALDKYLPQLSYYAVTASNESKQHALIASIKEKFRNNALEFTIDELHLCDQYANFFLMDIRSEEPELTELYDEATLNKMSDSLDKFTRRLNDFVCDVCIDS